MKRREDIQLRREEERRYRTVEGSFTGHRGRGLVRRGRVLTKPLSLLALQDIVPDDNRLALH